MGFYVVDSEEGGGGLIGLTPSQGICTEMDRRANATVSICHKNF